MVRHVTAAIVTAMKILLFLGAVALHAQSPLSTPVIVLPNGAHTVGGEIQVLAPNGTDYGDFQCTVNACILKGKAANNGNIVLTPGNVAGGNLASVVVESPRFDTPAVVVQDNYGTFDSVNVGDRYIYSLAGNTGGDFIWKLGLAGSSTNPVLVLANGTGTGGFDAHGAQIYCSIVQCQMQNIALGPPNGSGTTGEVIVDDGSNVARIIENNNGITLYDGGSALQMTLGTNGAVVIPNFAGGGTQCAQFNNLGQLGVTGTACGSGGGGGITSISTVSPIVGGPITTTGSLSCPTCLVTGGGQTITGTDTWNVTQIYASAAYLNFNSQFFYGTAFTNRLDWLDPSSHIIMSLDDTGLAGAGNILRAPSVVATASNGVTPTLQAIENPGQSADILDIDTASTKALWVDNGGNINTAFNVNASAAISANGGIVARALADVDSALTVFGHSMTQSADVFQVFNYGGGSKDLWVDSMGGTHILNCVSGCTSGVTSITFSAPLTGGTITTTGTAGCPTCLTTAGGQTITGYDSWSTGVPLTINPSVNEINPGVNSWSIGDASNTLAALYATNVRLSPSTGSLVWGPSSTASLNAGGGATFAASISVLGGTITSANIAGSGTQCLEANNAGQIISSGVGACGSGGGPCLTCLTTAGGQTITGTDTWTAQLNATVFNATNAGAGNTFNNNDGTFSVTAGGIVIGLSHLSTNTGTGAAFGNTSGNFEVNGNGAASFTGSIVVNGSPGIVVAADYQTFSHFGLGTTVTIGSCTLQFDGGILWQKTGSC